MPAYLRSTRRAGARLAARRARFGPVSVLFVTASLTLVAGVAMLAVQFAPMFGPVYDTSTLPAPGGSIAIVLPSESPAVTAATPSPTAPAAGVAAPSSKRLVDGVNFELVVPAIRYSGLVRQGVTTAVLALGPGHYPTTAWPGQQGNVGVAAHNTYWLGFNRLHAGDLVELQTQHRLYVYKITGSKVVSPGDRSVLAQSADHRLTLTTCYPLWAGAFATQRLVFTATEVSGAV